MARLLVKQFGATGVNVFQNAGTSAGQTVPHYHVHVVPRYSSSDPAKRFREADYDLAPTEHLRAIAEALNEPRDAVLGQQQTLYEKYPRNPRIWWSLFVGWMVIALASLARLITAPKTGSDWPATVPYVVQLAAVLVGSVTTNARHRRGLIAGYILSIGLFTLSVMLTF